MALRAGMSAVVEHLRTLTNAGTADSTLGTITYWIDDQLQDVLDRRRVDLYAIPLEVLPEWSGGNTLYKAYKIPFQWIERGTVSSGLALLNSTGGTVTTGYTIDYDTQLITFTSDTGGSVYYLNCRRYDMNNAAADVWSQKASLVAANVNWSSDNHRFDAAQEYDHYQRMASHYRNKAGGGHARFVRVDEVGH